MTVLASLVCLPERIKEGAKKRVLIVRINHWHQKLPLHTAPPCWIRLWPGFYPRAFVENCRVIELVEPSRWVWLRKETAQENPEKIALLPGRLQASPRPCTWEKPEASYLKETWAHQNPGMDGGGAPPHQSSLWYCWLLMEGKSVFLWCVASGGLSLLRALTGFSRLKKRQHKAGRLLCPSKLMVKLLL